MQHESSGLARIAGLLLAACLASLHATPAAAHAFVVASTPAADARVDGTKVTIDLRFNSRIDRSRSRMALVDGANRQTPLDLIDDAAADHLRSTVENLAPGDYRIDWYVLSGDGHITRGNVPFHVQKP